MVSKIRGPPLPLTESNRYPKWRHSAQDERRAPCTPSENMQAVIGRVRYRVADATLLAHDEYWDRRNYERHFRKKFLYRSPKCSSCRRSRAVIRR